MRGSITRKLTLFTAVGGIAAGFAVFVPASAHAAETDAQTRPSDSTVARDAERAIIRLRIDGKLGEPPTVIREGPEEADRQTVIVAIPGDDALTVSKVADGAGNATVRRLILRRQAEDGADPAPAGIRVIDASARPEGRESGPFFLFKGPGTPHGKVEKVTTLGVETSPSPAVLTHQLRLAEGFGLVVDEVSPESSADKAGLKQYDVLEKLDDQRLVDVPQLAALVRSHKPGETVTLGVIREGKPLNLKATLGEREEPAGAEAANRFWMRFRLPPGAEAQAEVAKRMKELWAKPPFPPAPPAPPAPPEPRVWKAVPLPGQPVPPGAGREAPNPKPAERPRGGALAPGASAPGAAPNPSRVAPPADLGNVRDDEVRQLEQEVRRMQAEAAELRDQIKAREKHEAEELKDRQKDDKGKGDADKGKSEKDDSGKDKKEDGAKP